MATFPELFGEATTGKTKTWSIRVINQGNTYSIVRTHGYIDGKKQENAKLVSGGKNIGKKNETTILQQAINDARAAWTKKMESGYSVKNTGEVVGGVVDNTNMIIVTEGEDGVDGVKGNRSKGIDDTVPLPMLAHDYNKRGKSIHFPCFVQRKFDGTRCIGIPGKGLFSRNRKTYPNLQHILSEINRLPSNIILDGELYSDTLSFQEIVGIVKRETLKEGDDIKQLQIKFYIYDLVNELPYSQRWANLQLLFKRYKFQHLVLVATEECRSEDKMKELHSAYVAEGFEGIMLRNKEGIYKNSRSTDLQKYKEFMDEEYEIVEYKEGEGLEEGCIIWLCKTPEGKVFNCRPRGSREERQELFLNGDKYIGKMLTVRFQELTDEKVPRFPVGIEIRDYE